MNNGQFSPREALWADGWFGQWCKIVHLHPHEAPAGHHVAPRGFAVNLEGTDGLQRTVSMEAGNSLFLDPSPLLALIDEQRESLQESTSVRNTLTPAERAGQVVLLKKLKTTFDPSPIVLARRGERKRVAQTVQAIIGLSNIIQVLRKDAKARSKAAGTSEPQTDGITITSLAVKTYSPVMDAGAAITLMPPSSADDRDAAPMVWQVKDHSDSGSRLRGKIDDLNRVIPGSLIAIREDESSPWSVTVVRRLRRLMVDYVEIGVEHLGRGPRFVKLVADRAANSSVDESADSTHRCFAALYLPPSELRPTMPIKTLLLPARDFTKRLCLEAIVFQRNLRAASQRSDPATVRVHPEPVHGDRKGASVERREVDRSRRRLARYPRKTPRICHSAHLGVRGDAINGAWRARSTNAGEIR